LGYSLGVVGVLSVAAVVATLVIRRRRTARANRGSVPSGAAEKADRRELFAVTDGREIALGPLTEVRRLDIGTSSRATVPVMGDSLLPRHVVLKRDGDLFRLRNLSRALLTANGAPVAPRGRARVVLPLYLALTDKTEVALRVRDQKGAENE
jgi:hypothetical protein